MQTALDVLIATMADGGHEPRVTVHHLRARYIRVRCAFCGLQAEVRYSIRGGDLTDRVFGPAASSDCTRITVQGFSCAEA